MELFKMVSMTETDAGNFLPSEFVIPFNKYKLPRKKNAGFIRDAAATIIVKIMTLQQNLKKQNNLRERLLSFVSTLFFIKEHCVPRSEDIQQNVHLLKQ